MRLVLCVWNMNHIYTCIVKNVCVYAYILHRSIAGWPVINLLNDWFGWESLNPIKPNQSSWIWIYANVRPSPLLVHICICVFVYACGLAKSMWTGHYVYPSGVPVTRSKRAFKYDGRFGRQSRDDHMDAHMRFYSTRGMFANEWRRLGYYMYGKDGEAP